MSEQIKEEWRPVLEYEGLYEVSNTGLVRRICYKRIKKTKTLSMYINHDGYCRVVLSKNGKTKQYSVHRLVAFSFIPNPNNYLEINHKDEIKTNNRADNLEWCTHKYNNNYRDKGKRQSKIVSKIVYQYDLNFNLIKIWDSGKEAEKNGFKSPSISLCCHKKQLTHKNFIWSFSEIFDKTKIEMKEKLNKTQKPSRFRKKVYQYTKDKKIVKIWNYLKQCKEEGFDISCISNCCHGRYKIHKGYIWSYNKL